MQELFIKVIESSPEPNRGWISELWSGPPTPAGKPLIATNAPYTQQQLERPLPDGTEMTHAAMLENIRNEDRPSPVFTEIGLRLYELLDVTGIAAEWRKLRDEAEGRGESVRTYLDLPPVLQELPWELLAWQVDAGLRAYPFMIVRHPLLRVAPPVAGEAWQGTTVRILLVSGQDVLDGANRAYDELRLIRKIFQYANKSVLVDLCEAPQDFELEDRITFWKPHILHFIGHGNDPTGTGFALQFFNQNGQWEWSTERIWRFFDNLRVKPRLVVLNSCHSSRREVNAAPASVAILRAGVPAVIGALAALQIEYAKSFSMSFYAALAEGNDLDTATMMARNKLANASPYQGTNRRHWALPVLTTRASPPDIIRFKQSTPILKSCEVSGAVFERRGRFVDRTSDRWSMLSAFQPADPAAPRFRGVIVDSPYAQVGKDWLIRRAARDFLDSDFIVRYTELVGPLSRTSLDVLQEWRGRSGVNSPLMAPPPNSARHFEAFDRALAAVRHDPKARDIEEVFRTFKAGFQSYRNGRNVLFILGRLRAGNKLTVSSQDFRENLLEKLLLPIRGTDAENPEVAGFHALLIVRTQTDAQASSQPSDLDEFALERLSLSVPEETRTPAEGFRRHSISQFDAADVDRHFDEFSEFVTNTGTDVLRDWVKFAIEQRAWSPACLKQVELMLQQALQRPPHTGS
jgi:hypothetical protein